MPEPWLIGALVVSVFLLVLIAVLSSLETAVLNARRSRLASLSPRAADAAASVLEDPDQFQTSAHLAKSLAESLLYATAAFTGLYLALPSGQGAAMGTMAELLARTWPGILGGALTAYLCVTLLGEALPKTLTCQSPERTLARSVGFIRAFTAAFTPIWWLTRGVGRFLVKTAGGDGGGASRAAHSEEEIKLLLEDSAEEGVLEVEEKEMIHSIIEFTDTVARQVMIPRIDVSSISAEATLEGVVEEVLKSGHSRLPVYEGTLDTVVGVIHIKDLLGHLAHGDQVSLRDIMRDPYFIPEGKKLDELLQEFRRQKSQMAIVVDEFGGTSGLVTVEDILEEIVGEIEDEYDVDESPATQVEDTEGGGVLANGRMTVQDLNEQLELDLPPGDYDTLGGFVFSLFGRPPQVGEQVSYGNIHFLVEELDGLRIQKIRIVRETPAEEEAADGSL